MASTTVPPSVLKASHVFGDPQLHTDGDLLALTFARDGSLWSVDEPGVLRHWDTTSGRQIEWHWLSDMETCWCFSPDARVLASASNDLTFWDTSSGQVLTAVPQPSWVTALAFAPDPAFLATGHDDGAVRLWDAAGHHLVREFRLHKSPVSAVMFSADGSRLASAGEDRLIGVWNVADGQLQGKLSGHTDRIPALAWHPGGKALVSAGWDTTARIWDANTLDPLLLLNTHDNQVTALAFNKDGSLLATGDSALKVRVWTFATNKEMHVLTGPQAEIRALVFSADSKRLAATGDRVIHVWDAQSGKELAGGGERILSVPTLALSSDGGRLAANGGGSAPRLWSIGKPASIALAEPEVVHGLAFSPDGRWLVGAAEKHVRVWDAATGEAKAVFDGPEELITCVAVSPDASTVASASNTGLAVWLWRLSDGEPILLIPDALDGCTVEALAFHPKGQLLAVAGIDWLATGGSDGAVCLWNIAERCEVATFADGSTAVAFHPTGDRLVSAALDQSLTIWDVNKDVNKQEPLAELIGHDAKVNGVAYGPGGRWLVSGGDDRTLRVWSEDGDELAVFELDTQIKAVAFSRDGKFLYTANGNTTCSQFDVKNLTA